MSMEIFFWKEIDDGGLQIPQKITIQRVFLFFSLFVILNVTKLKFCKNSIKKKIDLC